MAAHSYVDVLIKSNPIALQQVKCLRLNFVAVSFVSHISC